MANINCSGQVKANNLELKSSFEALTEIGGGFKISDPVNVGIELGRKDGTPGTPYIDFHTDGNPNTDYNSRINANGNQLDVYAQGGLLLNNNKILVSKSNGVPNGKIPQVSYYKHTRSMATDETVYLTPNSFGFENAILCIVACIRQGNASGTRDPLLVYEDSATSWRVISDGGSVNGFYAIAIGY